MFEDSYKKYKANVSNDTEVKKGLLNIIVTYVCGDTVPVTVHELAEYGSFELTHWQARHGDFHHVASVLTPSFSNNKNQGVFTTNCGEVYLVVLGTSRVASLRPIERESEYVNHKKCAIVDRDLHEKFKVLHDEHGLDLSEDKFVDYIIKSVSFYTYERILFRNRILIAANDWYSGMTSSMIIAIMGSDAREKAIKDNPVAMEMLSKLSEIIFFTYKDSLVICHDFFNEIISEVITEIHSLIDEPLDFPLMIKRFNDEHVPSGDQTVREHNGI